MTNKTNVYLQLRDASDRIEDAPRNGVLKFPIRKIHSLYSILSTCIIFLLIYAGTLFLLPSVGASGFLMQVVKIGIPVCVLLMVLYMLISAYTARVVIDDEGMKCPESEDLAWDRIEMATLSDNIFWDDPLGLKKRNPQAYGTVELRFRDSDAPVEEQEWMVHRILNYVTNEDQPLVLRVIRDRLGDRFIFPNNQE